MFLLLLLSLVGGVHAAPSYMMEAPAPDAEPRNARDLARDAYPASATFELPGLSADERRRIRELAARTRPTYSGIGRDLALAARHWALVGQRDGFDVWQVQIRSPAAVELQVHFSGFDMGERSFVNVYSMAASAPRVQRYAGQGPGDGGRFWSQPAEGEVIVVEFWTPTAAALKPPAFPFSNDRISHTFRREDGSLQGVALPAGASASGGVSGAQEPSCDVDISVCDRPQASTQTRGSVAHYYVMTPQGARIGGCTGNLINNEAGDGALYFLTAWHCIRRVVESHEAPMGTFINATFQFSRNGCGSPVISGQNARFIAANPRGDYALLRIEGSLTGGGHYALLGWDANFLADSSTISIVHHANGGDQKYGEATILARTYSIPREDGNDVQAACRTDGCSHYEIRHSIGGISGGASGASVLRGSGDSVRIAGVATHVQADSTCVGYISAFPKIYEDGRVRGALTFGAAYYKGDGPAFGFDDSMRPGYERVRPDFYPGNFVVSRPGEIDVAVGDSVTSTVVVANVLYLASTVLEADQPYRFDLEGADTGGGTLADPHLRLISSDGRTLARDSGGGVGRNARLGYVPEIGGFYYLGIIGADRGTGTYTLSVSQTRDDLPAELDTTATIDAAMAAAGTAVGTIDFLGDEDWFRITLEAGRRYRFDLEGVQTGKGTLVDPFFSLRGGDGEPLLHNDDIEAGIMRNSRLAYAPREGGLHYLVADAWNDRVVGSYTLSVSEMGAASDDHPGRRESAARIAVAGATTAMIDFYGDTDWFGVTLQAGRAYRFDLEGLDSAKGTLADPYLRLRNSDGALLQQDDDGGGGRNARVGYVASATGLHYLVAGAFRDASVGTYTLSAATATRSLALNGGREPAQPLAEGASRDYEVMLGLPARTALSEDVTVRWTLASDGAGVGMATPPDFIAASGTLAFAAGDGAGATKTFTVMARNDDLNEGDEQYSIYLQAPDASQFFAGGAIVGTIGDGDEDAISVTLPTSLPNRSVSLSEGQQTPTQTFTLTGGRPTDDVVLPYTVDGDAQITTSDYMLVGGAGVRFTSAAAIVSVAAAASPTFVVRALDDGIDEGRERLVMLFDNAAARSAGSVAADLGALFVNIEANGITSVTVHARVFLQGAYDARSRMMKTAVIDRLPTRQPYGASPWGYPRIVGVPGIAGDFGLAEAAPNAVDWMLMELRTAERGEAMPSADASLQMDRMVGLLMRDGVIAGVNADAASPAAAVVAAGVRLDTLLDHRDRDLYVLLHHRNHLPVMSALPATSSDCAADYCVDFTQQQSRGSNSRELADGVFGMIAGDVNRDGMIDFDDEALIRANNLTIIGPRDYDPAATLRNYVVDADLNLDGEVLSLDRFFVITNDGASACLLCRP